ncbi:MAG: HAMP domain-containing histidine kinase [Saccharospirillum sp.]|nr:HAMP domain-containing histidine kinase [Saccharospirillum sp.]
MLLSFALALIPLGVLLWQSHQALNRISAVAVTEAERALTRVRLGEQLRTSLTDLERASRQLEVLQTDSLAKLTEQHQNQYQQRLSTLCATLISNHASELCQQQHRALTQWVETDSDEEPSQLDERFQQLTEQQARLVRLLNQELDEQLLSQQNYVGDWQRSIAIQTVIWVVFSLFLVIWGSARISNPVRRLEQMIRALGQADAPLAPVAIRGPRELNALGGHLMNLDQRLHTLENLRVALLRHAAHELKTPLASLREGCSLLADSVAGPLNEHQREVVHLLSKSTHRLTVLTEQLLDYNRLLQQARPDWQQIEVEPLLEETFANHQLALSQRGQSVKVDCRIKTLCTDARLLRRILDNLLDNAQAYGQANAPVWLRLYHHQHRAIVEVANLGNPATRAEGAELFKPFQRGLARRADASTGSGLGLSIVADCARLLGGDAQLVDAAGADFCVRVRLPHTNNKDF